MKTKEIIGRIAIISGVAAVGGSAADFMLNNRALQEEFAGQAKITESVRDEQGITQACNPVGMFSNNTSMACFDAVPSAQTREEERQILAQARTDIEGQVAAVRNPVAEARGKGELAGIVSGLVLLAGGAKLAGRKETKNE